MRPVIVCAIAVVGLTACSNSSSSKPDSASANSTPVGTVPAPGNCVAGEVLPAVTLVVDGKSVDPTFGIGSSECAALTGTGYIAFDYDPTLIDTAKAIVLCGERLIEAEHQDFTVGTGVRRRVEALE